MAMVRQAVGRAVVTTGTGGTVPHQPGAAPGPAPEMAAAAGSPPANGWAVLSGLGLTGLGAVGAWNIGTMVQPTVFQVGNQMSAFAALFVFAAAVERVLEPFTRWLPGRAAQERYEKALADMDNGVPGATAAAAQFKAMVDQARATRAILLWGMATFLATLLSAGAGFYLLRLISASPTWNGVSTWIDALVTGLVVGSGTKPLHDIVTRLQRPTT